MAKTVKQIKAEVERLSAASIDSDCRNVDWTETMGENMDGWTCYNQLYCDECKQYVLVSQLGETRHCEADERTECRGYLNNEGPMMNYFYPADFGMSCGEAASLCEGCCVVVEFENGDHGFALAGGGMDCSWQIAGSYVACGLLPPAWIRLPMMGGISLTPHNRLIIEACKMAAECMAERARYAVGDLERLEKWMREEGKKRKSNKKAA